MENNGLKLRYVKSTVNPVGLSDTELKVFTDLENLISKIFQSDGFVVAYLDYKVLIGKINKSKLEFFEGETFLPKFVKKLRAFNYEKEFFLWRENKGFSARLRIDEIGVEIPVIEAKQILWGTKNPPLDVSGYTKLYEDRGTEIVLPFASLEVDEQNRVAIKTRNYIIDNEFGQCSYNDTRFVEFLLVNKKDKNICLEVENE